MSCTDGGSLYKNVDQTFGLCLPTGWYVRANVDTAELEVTSPPTGPDDVFNENVNLIRERVAANVTLQQYADMDLAKVPTYIHDFKIQGRANKTIAGEPASLIEYTGNYSPGNNVSLPLHWQQTVVLHGGVAYKFTYTALDGVQGAFQSTVDHMLASLKFLN